MKSPRDFFAVPTDLKRSDKIGHVCAIALGNINHILNNESSKFYNFNDIHIRIPAEYTFIETPEIFFPEFNDVPLEEYLIFLNLKLKAHGWRLIEKKFDGDYLLVPISQDNTDRRND